MRTNIRHQTARVAAREAERRAKRTAELKQNRQEVRDLENNWPTNKFDLFVDPYDFELKLPNSCIESAEYGMQCIKLKQRLTYTPPNPNVEPKKPYVMARFGIKVDKKWIRDKLTSKKLKDALKQLRLRNKQVQERDKTN